MGRLSGWLSFPHANGLGPAHTTINRVAMNAPLEKGLGRDLFEKMLAVVAGRMMDGTVACTSCATASRVPGSSNAP